MKSYDTNIFIDTQSYHIYDMRCISGATRLFCFSTYNEEFAMYNYELVQRAANHHRLWYYEYECRIANFKARIRTQVNSQNHAPYRHNGATAYSYKAIENHLEHLAQAVNEEDEAEICQSLNDINNWDSQFAKRVYHNIRADHCDNILICSDCAAFMLEDYVTNSNNERICEHCSLDNYNYSSCMGTYIHADSAYPVYGTVRAWRNENADDWCTERYGLRNLYEYDGVYFSDDEACYDARAENGDDEDRDDYDERQRNENYLAGWHGTTRNFVEKNASQAYPALGAELEVYIPNRDPYVGRTRGVFNEELILESDGSLCSYHGIEMISHPLGREEWDEFAPRWLKHVQDYGGVGYNEPAGEKYGIHLTIHRKNFSPLAEARLVMFLTSTDNAQFVRAVAQRNQIYAADNGLGIGSMMHPQLSVVSPNGFSERYNDRNGRTEMKMCGRGKFCPINFKDDLAEFRIFQSTTNIVSFQKNLEFVWALWAWTKPETASGNSHNYKDFVLWLNKRQQRKQFPTLIKFLSKKVFYGTNFPPLLSPWHNLMTLPTEDHAVESMAA